MTSARRLAPAPISAVARPVKRWPFAFGPRVFLLLCAGCVWLAPAWGDPRFLVLMAAWDLLVLAAWAYDLRRIPPPERIEVARAWPQPAALDTDGSIDLRIRVHDPEPGFRLRARLVDDLPAALRRAPPLVELLTGPGGAAAASYGIHPIERGDFALGEVFLSYQGRLRLAERWAAAGLHQTVRVYPDIEQSRRHTIYLIRSRQIVQERRLRRKRGTGREFESLRDYRAGDQMRDICWTASARRAKMISKNHQVERSQAIWLVVDAGRLLRARVFGLTKLDHAVNAALSLAQAALHSGDRVGLLAYGRRLQQRLGAGRGAPHLRAMLECLALVRAESAEADHARAAGALLQDQKHRSLVVWLTDLAETATMPEVIESAAHVSSRHLVLFVAIGQPELHGLVAQAPESTEQMYRYVSALEMIDRRELLLKSLRLRGVLAMEVHPGGLSAALVNRYLEIKERALI